MDINIKRFVNIDITHHEASTTNSIRDVAVLMTSEGTTSIEDKTFSSLSEFKADSTYANLTETSKYAEMFFNNSGIKLHIFCGISSSNDIISTIDKLPNEEIVIAYCGNESEIEKAALSMTSNEGSTSDITKVYGINRKIFVARLESATDKKSINDFVVKISSITGAEMTIAAYLTTIKIYGSDTIKDYAFTKETIKAETNDDTILGNVLDNNMNVDMTLANATRNLGGNMTNGYDLVNEYTLIVMHQTISSRLVSLLTEKIKGNSGTSAIYTAIASELGRYITNGYLAQDKVWTDETKTYTDSKGKTYTLIEQNTPLTLGYKIAVLPFSSLSDEDRAAHKCPPIYIFVADSYGIRNITINGEVI